MTLPYPNFASLPVKNMIANLILATSAVVSVFGSLASIGIFQFGTKEADEWLAKEEEQHRALVDVLQSGRFPDTPEWRKVAELGERMGPDGKSLIRDYVTVLSQLILSGETKLLNKTEDKVVADDNGLSEKFDRLSELQRRLGKATLSALTAMLPFSRNDYWELKELREDVKAGRKSRPAPLPDVN